LTNEAKYTESGGRIWLTAEREGALVVLKVRDTGIGILAETLPKVFDMFIQADWSLDRSQGGLGIGLTLVRTLVQMHGGSVKAHSEGVGKGSEFTVRLPVAPEVAELKSEALPEVEGKKVRPLRLLVVEDNIDTAERLAILLRWYGHEVMVAHTGPTGLEAAHLHKPEVVLLDIGLPGMDGFQVARRLKDAVGFEHVPLIAMTGYGQDGDRERSEEAGFDRHLVKPVDPEKLQDLLAEIMHGR
jgi:CheY-like chemotaxis protein